MMKKKIWILLLCITILMLLLVSCGQMGNTTASTQTTSVTTAGSAAQTTTEVREDAEPTYTYNTYISGMPHNWSPHAWENVFDSYIASYTQLGLYNFYLNDTKDGYKIIPEMAAEMPEDITETVAGNITYGVPEGATKGYAFRIRLQEQACWEDGTPITAQDYVYSMQQLLDPALDNYRASAYSEGQLVLANAKNYIDSDKAGQNKYMSLAELGYANANEAIMVGHGELYIDMQNFFGITDASGNGMFRITDEQELRDERVPLGQEGDYVSPREVYEKNLADYMLYADYQAEYLFLCVGVYEKTEWETVGIYAEDPYTLVLVLEAPISDFYLYYNLSSGWLVHEKIYEASRTLEKDSGRAGTEYGTSVETYSSYGPYKLTQFGEEAIVMEKNDKWFGYYDEVHEGMYQTTKIYTRILDTQVTALELFLDGKLDNVSLTVDNMETYRVSDYVMYTPESYTVKLSFNSSKTALQALEDSMGPDVDMTMLAYKDFREAIALSIDRTAFVEECTAAHQPGYGLLNYMYVYDPETGALYRDSAEAKAALCKAYDTDDESMITGYDPERASELFAKSYWDAVDAGDLKEGDTVYINFHIRQLNDGYKKMFRFIKESILLTSQGTPFEGKIQVNFVEDPEYAENVMNGKTGIIFSAWGGAAMDPFSIMECYVNPALYLEYGFDHTAPLTLTINGVKETRSWYEWYLAISNADYAAADMKTKLQILAGFEAAYLKTFVCTPLYYRNSVFLRSQKVEFATENYVQIVGFGGVAEATYHYSDEEWEAYLKQNSLKY